MKMFSIGNYLTPYLLTACALSAGVLSIESGNLIETQDHASPETQTAVDPIEQAKFTAPGIAAFSEITERPLFREDREPPTEAKPTPVAARKSPLRLKLEGVAITPGSKIAVLRDLSNNKMLHLETGMKHQGWELTSVTDTVATFKLGEQSQELTLKK